MHSLSRFTILFLALVASLAAQSQIDGSRFHELTRDFETPHLDWIEALPGGPLKALYVISLSQARQVVETAQRMPLDYQAVTTSLRSFDFGITAADDGWYGGLYTGTSPDAKAEELLAKLDREDEVYVICGVDLDKIPARAKLRMLERVHAGAGLVLYGVRGDGPLKPLFAKPDEAAQAAILSAAPADESLRCYRFGEGRVVRANRMIVAPFHYTDPSWWADYEAAQVLVMRTLLWAAGRPVTLDAGDWWPDRVVGRYRGPTAQRFRRRGAWNRVLAEHRGELEPGPGPWDTLPTATGNYHHDIVLPDGTPATRTFAVDSNYHAELRRDGDTVADFSPIRATLRLSRPVPEGRAVIRLIDLPYEREWYRREIALPAAGEVAIELADYYLPTAAAVLRVDIHTDLRQAGRRHLASAEKMLYFPYYQQHAPTYEATLWEYNPGGIDRIRAMAEYDVMGYTGLYNRIDGDRPPPQVYMRLNLRHGAHNFGFGFGQGAVGRGDLTDEERALIESLDGNFSPGNPNTEPAIRAVVRSMIRHKQLDKYPLSFYGMGNETKLPYTTGFTEDDNRFFQQMLAARYGDIATLNREWGRDYESFAAVPNMNMEEARVEGRYPEYLAHRRLVDETVRQRFEIITDEVHKVDPHAKMGCDGTWALSNDGINIEALLANPRVSHWEQYSRLPRAEVLRSLRPHVGGYLWGWIISNESYPTAPWFNMLIGCGNHSNWFLSGCSVGGVQLSADYRPWRPRMVREQEKLRTGVAQLLIETPLRNDGLAIWESYDSNVAGLLGDPRLPRSTDSSMPLIEHCYQRGIGFAFLARRGMAEKLRDYKVLILPGTTSISAEEAREMLAFVAAGGILIADVNPGIMNDSFGFLAENRLRQLFGTLDPEAAPVRQAMAFDTKLNDRRVQLRCEAASGILGLAPFAVREHGKGKAILLNFTLGSARESADPAAFAAFLDDLLAACGVTPAATFEGLPPDSVVRVRQGAGFQLVGITHRRMAAAGEDGTEEITMRLPGKRHVYEVATGAIGGVAVHETDRVTFKLAPPFRVFALFDEPRDRPPPKLLAPPRAGQALELALPAFPAGRVLRVQLQDAQGEPVLPRIEAVRREVLIFDPAKPVHRVHLPYNFPAGDYRVAVTDVATGQSHHLSFSISE